MNDFLSTVTVFAEDCDRTRKGSGLGAPLASPMDPKTVLYSFSHNCAAPLQWINAHRSPLALEDFLSTDRFCCDNADRTKNVFQRQRGYGERPKRLR